ncbi:helix-turn-helix domain-containing protein [Reinekea marinisedimentorum]|uniref:AraC-like DNA-binding protein n=1 Tax=Reinekea marinisedimentorum TaxID=230495 RepID=A0A4R3IA07_9GAMM|nr:AraC family transcriptional regulator [Reinekea marinisedimentorum]TCS41155.1 AraC-like DNA-binding protein [Reinekea marinisedimentorum]
MNVSDLLVGVSLSQAVFVILLTFSKAKRRVDDVIILVWILFLILPMLAKLFSSDLVNLPIPFLRADLPYPLLHGPMLWLYTCSLTGKKIHMNLDTFRHAMPFVFGSTLTIVTAKAGSAALNTTPAVSPDQLVGALILVSLLIYSARVLWHLREYESSGQLNDLSARITLKWLTWLTLAVIILPAVQNILGLSIWLPSYGFAFAAFIFILEFLSIRKTIRERYVAEPPPCISEVAKNPTPEQTPLHCLPETRGPEPDAAEDACKKEKYARSGLTNEKCCEYLDRLSAFMEREKPYLDANITIEAMAHQLGISRNHLTQILNEKLETNFYSYINEYRIDTFKQLVSDPVNQKTTLISLAYDSGFNTKSTFNTAFKKIEGVTPSQYRKSINLQSCAA